MQRTRIPGLFTWSEWQPDRNLFFNSAFVAHPGGNMLVDPLPLGESDAAHIDELGGAAWIVVTNRDHERAARAAAARFSAKVAASEHETPLLSVAVDRGLQEGATLCGAAVLAFAGLKTPGEIALHLREHRAVIVGDALWGDPAGSLRLMPDEKLADPARAALSLRKLWALQPTDLLVGDGTAIFGNADAEIRRCLEARGDVYVNRIAESELDWEAYGGPESGRPPYFASACAEIGLLIGARKLGYRLVSLEPKKRFCPLHAHALEEEFYYVLAGEPTVRTPRGDVVCGKGDFIAFPVGDHGAHQLVNEADVPCTVLMVSNCDPNELCYYPESDKVLIRARGGLMLRAAPALDYFDGE